MPWSGVTGAIARCKSRSIACVHKSRFVLAWRWICGVKPKPKAVNKPSHHSIRPELDKPGVFTTVSVSGGDTTCRTPLCPRGAVWGGDDGVGAILAGFSRRITYTQRAHS